MAVERWGRVGYHIYLFAVINVLEGERISLTTMMMVNVVYNIGKAGEPSKITAARCPICCFIFQRLSSSLARCCCCCCIRSSCPLLWYNWSYVEVAHRRAKMEKTSFATFTYLHYLIFERLVIEKPLVSFRPFLLLLPRFLSKSSCFFFFSTFFFFFFFRSPSLTLFRHSEVLIYSCLDCLHASERLAIFGEVWTVTAVPIWIELRWG